MKLGRLGGLQCFKYRIWVWMIKFSAYVQSANTKCIYYPYISCLLGPSINDVTQRGGGSVMCDEVWRGGGSKMWRHNGKILNSSFAPPPPRSRPPHTGKNMRNAGKATGLEGGGFEFCDVIFGGVGRFVTTRAQGGCQKWPKTRDVIYGRPHSTYFPFLNAFVDPV